MITSSTSSKKQNQEAGHWANLGAEGQRTTIVDKGTHTERWTAVQGFWNGSFKVHGRGGCGVVVKDVDKDKWITTSKIAVLWGLCTALAAEVFGACVLTGILDLVLHKRLCVRNNNQCVNAMVKNLSIGVKVRGKCS